MLKTIDRIIDEVRTLDFKFTPLYQHIEQDLQSSKISKLIRDYAVRVENIEFKLRIKIDDEFILNFNFYKFLNLEKLGIKNDDLLDYLGLVDTKFGQTKDYKFNAYSDESLHYDILRQSLEICKSVAIIANNRLRETIKKMESENERD